MILYSDCRVIDGDTIELKLWPSGRLVRCRLAIIDCDERNTKRGLHQKKVLENFFKVPFFKPYVSEIKKESKNGWSWKQCHYGRALVKIKVWHWFRYVDYGNFMIKKGWVKK